MIEGSGSIPLTNESGSGSREAKKHTDPTDPGPQHCCKEELLNLTRYHFYESRPKVDKGDKLIIYLTTIFCTVYVHIVQYLKTRLQKDKLQDFPRAFFWLCHGNLVSFVP